MIIESFTIKKETNLYKIWPWNRDLKYFFKENLPCFFHRTVTFTHLDLQGGMLSWRFTGPYARIQIDVSDSKLKVSQLFTDSYGLYEGNPYEEVDKVFRFPEKAMKEDTVLLDEQVTSILVVYDHHLNFSVYVNGNKLITQHCTLDLIRHQFFFENTDASAIGSLTCEENKEVVITIDESKTYQTIKGFGGTTSVVSYQALSDEGKKAWWDFVKDYNLLIQREYPSRITDENKNVLWDDANYAVPHTYGNNFPIGEISDFAYNKKIQELGGEVWFEFWQYPEDMVEDDTYTVPLSYNHVNADRFVEVVIDYCKKAKQKTGKAPTVIGIENEILQPSKKIQEMVQKLRKGLDTYGFDTTKIHMSDASKLCENEFLDYFMEDKKTWDMIDYAASHVYDYQKYFKDLDAFDPMMKAWHKKSGGKEFLSTEICIQDKSYYMNSYRIAFVLGELYHKNMTLLNASAVCYCWMLLHTAERGFEWTRTLFEVDESSGFVPKPGSFELRTYGSFSRHIKKEMKRIECFSDSDDLLCSAYKGERGAITFVVLNRGTCSVKIKSEKFTQLRDFKCELTNYYNQNKPLISNDNKEFVLQPGDIMTIYRTEDSEINL